MLTFPTETHRLQYAISGHEVLPPHGPMLAYVQSSGKYYQPNAAGRGSAKWDYKGTATNRAYGGGNTLKLNEAVADQAKETVLPGDERIIIDSLLLDGELVLGQTAQLTFLPGQGGEFIAADDIVYERDDRTVDEEYTLDGELVFESPNRRWVINNDPDTYGLTGLDGDTAFDTSTELEWTNEAGTWVPQTDDIARIIASADQVFWYDSAAYTIDTGVDATPDLFGTAANDLAQGTGAAQPTVPNTPLLVNPFLFDGTDDELTITGASIAGDVDVFLVVRNNGWANGDVIFQLDDEGSHTLRLIQTTTPNWRIQIDGSSGSGGESTTGAASGAPYYLVRLLYVESTGAISISINNEALNTGGVTPIATTWTAIHLGADGSAFANVSIASCIGASATQSLGRRIALTRAINKQKGLNIAEPTA